jgi:predicted ATPase
LAAADIATHLNTRFPRHRFPATFAPLLHQRTDGNPLFLVNMLDELQAQAAIVEQAGQWDLAVDVETIAVGTPVNTRELIEQHVDRLSPAEQHILEAASVVGVEFTVGAVAAALGTPLADVEAQCEHLARQGQFLRTAEVRELPGGTLTAQYAFVHAVYQGTIYDRISAARRIRWHQAIARWLEEVAGEYAVESAAELAVHYEQGRDYEHAVHYLAQAARKAMRRGAAYEAIRHLRKALHLLQTAPMTLDHIERELTVQTLLAPALMTAKGYGTTEVEQIYNRVLTLAQQVEDFPRVFPVLVGVGAFHAVRGKYRTAYEIATQLLRVAEREQDPGLLVEAHALMGFVAFYRGEFTAARAHLEQSMALYDSRVHQAHALHYGQDPWVVCCSYLAWTLWTLGYPDQAQERNREAIAYAQQLQHPMSLAFALGLAAIVQNACRDPQAGSERAEALITLANEHGLPFWVALGSIVRGRALVQGGRAHEGLAQLQQAMQERRTKDGLEGRPSFVIVAEAYAATGEAAAGLQVLAEAQAAQDDGEHYWEAEVYRLKGELLPGTWRQEAQ